MHMARPLPAPRRPLGPPSCSASANQDAEDSCNQACSRALTWKPKAYSRCFRSAEENARLAEDRKCEGQTTREAGLLSAAPFERITKEVLCGGVGGALRCPPPSLTNGRSSAVLSTRNLVLALFHTCHAVFFPASAAAGDGRVTSLLPPNPPPAICHAAPGRAGSGGPEPSIATASSPHLFGGGGGGHLYISPLPPPPGREARAGGHRMPCEAARQRGCVASRATCHTLFLPGAVAAVIHRLPCYRCLAARLLHPPPPSSPGEFLVLLSAARSQTGANGMCGEGFRIHHRLAEELAWSSCISCQSSAGGERVRETGEREGEGQGTLPPVSAAVGSRDKCLPRPPLILSLHLSQPAAGPPLQHAAPAAPEELFDSSRRRGDRAWLSSRSPSPSSSSESPPGISFQARIRRAALRRTICRARSMLPCAVASVSGFDSGISPVLGTQQRPLQRDYQTAPPPVTKSHPVFDYSPLKRNRAPLVLLLRFRGAGDPFSVLSGAQVVKWNPLHRVASKPQKAITREQKTTASSEMCSRSPPSEHQDIAPRPTRAPPPSEPSTGGLEVTVGSGSGHGVL
ncbi:unnamed protein product [Gadus morhua 'NCC']